jgi:predicted transcriptional regulator
MKNYNHDLIHQLSETLDSIWRLDEYIKNATECPRCQKLWAECKVDLEKIAQKISEELKQHIKEEKFS